MARVAERPCHPRVDAHPAEQALASGLDLPGSDHQALELVLKYGTGVPQVPRSCKLINPVGDRGNRMGESGPRALTSSAWHTRGCGYDPTCGRSELSGQVYALGSFRHYVHHWFGSVVRLYSITTFTRGLKLDACAAPPL